MCCPCRHWSMVGLVVARLPRDIFYSYFPEQAGRTVRDLCQSSATMYPPKGICVELSPHMVALWGSA